MKYCLIAYARTSTAFNLRFFIFAAAAYAAHTRAQPRIIIKFYEIVQFRRAICRRITSVERARSRH